ncbi:MAG: hypothetical protein ACLTW9_07395 [Enterocloster sp.]
MIQAVLRGRDGENRFGLQHPLLRSSGKMASSGKIALSGKIAVIG